MDRQSPCSHPRAQHLDGALDRFAQFFISPLFTESSTDRELNAVHSGMAAGVHAREKAKWKPNAVVFFAEHTKNVNSDMWRIYQLSKSLANPNHPFSKFGTGAWPCGKPQGLCRRAC